MSKSNWTGVQQLPQIIYYFLQFNPSRISSSLIHLAQHRNSRSSPCTFGWVFAGIAHITEASESDRAPAKNHKRRRLSTQKSPFSHTVLRTRGTHLARQIAPPQRGIQTAPLVATSLPRDPLRLVFVAPMVHVPKGFHDVQRSNGRIVGVRCRRRRRRVAAGGRLREDRSDDVGR